MVFMFNAVEKTVYFYFCINSGFAVMPTEKFKIDNVKVKEIHLLYRDNSKRC